MPKSNKVVPKWLECEQQIQALTNSCIAFQSQLNTCIEVIDGAVACIEVLKEKGLITDEDLQKEISDIRDKRQQHFKQL